MKTKNSKKIFFVVFVLAILAMANVFAENETTTITTTAPTTPAVENQTTAVEPIIAPAPTLTAANSEDKRGSSHSLLARYNYLLCRTNLVSASISDLIANVPQTASLSSEKDKLAQDMATLKAYVDSNDKASFDKFVTATLRGDIKTAQDLVKEQRKNLHIYNISNETRTILKTAWQKDISDFSTCNSESLKGIANNRLSEMNGQVTKWNEEISKLKAKGLDTQEQEKILADANQFSSLLNNAANSANESQVTKALEEARQLHLHLWARFEIARLNSHVLKAKDLASKANMTFNDSAIKDLLAKASTTAMAGRKYGDGDFKTTWQQIHDASARLNEASKQAREQFKEKMQAEKEQRKELRQEIRNEKIKQKNETKMLRQEERMENRSGRVGGEKPMPKFKMNGSENIAPPAQETEEVSNTTAQA